MSNWHGKYIIGLTGNIATGKTVVRRMLEHLGAYGIDADSLANRAVAKGAPGYQPVIDTFGNWLLDGTGEIDRNKLGRVVFSDPEALGKLEKIIHPLVIDAIELIVQHSRQKVIVIEAIKLLESDLRKMCDGIWVTDAPQDVQRNRLLHKRKMAEADARQRINNQSAQQDKIKAASVVIQNTGSFEDTWKQVVAAWKSISATTDSLPLVMRKSEVGGYTIQRGRPRDSMNIAGFITRVSKGLRPMTENDIMEAFGEKAFLLLMMKDNLVGLAGWQVENLVARTTDIYLDQRVAVQDALKMLVTEIEQASSDLQCEASLLFILPGTSEDEAFWRDLGYERRTIESLTVQAWRDAALESMPDHTILLFKQLRQDRVLRPI